MQPDQAAPSTAAQPVPPRPHAGTRLLRIAAWLGGTMFLLVALLAVAAYALVMTESGARILLDRLSLLIPGQIKAEWVSGSLSDGVSLRNIEYTDRITSGDKQAEKRIRIDRLAGKWSLSFDPLFLKVAYLDIGTVDAVLPPSPSDEPAVLPERLTLPFGFDLQRLSVGKAVIHGQAGEEDQTVYQDILLQADSDGTRHHLQLKKAGTPLGQANAVLKLDGLSYVTGGAVSMAGKRNGQGFHLNADLSGSLRELGVRARFGSGEAAGTADVSATPFGKVPFRHADIRVSALDPHVLNPAWPKALLDLNASLSPAGDVQDPSKLAVQGPVSVVNRQPGALDRQLLPVESIQAHILLDESERRLTRLDIKLEGGGALGGSGQINDRGQGRFELRADRLDLHAVHSALLPTRLEGPITAVLEEDAQSMEVQLADSDLSIAAKAESGPGRIFLRQARLAYGRALLEVGGEAARGEASDYSVQGKLRNFDPALFLSKNAKTVNRTAKADAKPSSQAGRARGSAASRVTRSQAPDTRRLQADINMDFQAAGSIKPELSAKLDFDIFDSSYAGRPMTGGGRLSFAGLRVHSSDAALSIAGNRVNVQGAFGSPSDRLRFSIDAPALAQLGLEPALSGLVKADGELSGSVEQPRLSAAFRAAGFKAGGLSVETLDGNLRLDGLPDASPNARTELKLSGRSFRSADLRVERFNAELTGSYAKHALRIEADGAMRTFGTHLSAAAQGGLSQTEEGFAWTGTVNRLEDRGTLGLLLQSPLSVDYAPGRLSLGGARLTVVRSQVQIRQLVYAGAQIRSQGSFSRLDTAHLMELYREFAEQAPPVRSSLVLDGAWDVALSDTAGGFVEVRRVQGDLGIVRGTKETPLGMTELSLRADLKGSQLQFAAKTAATRVGSAEAQGSLGINPGGDALVAPDASLSAQIRVQLPRLQSLAALAGPAVALDGSMDAALAISGTAGAPALSGDIAADRLSVSVYDLGMRLRDGIARLHIENNILEIRKFELRGGDGFLRAVGRVPLDQSMPDLRASISAENLLLLAGPAGQLTLSGGATASNVNRQLTVDGKFTVDRALFSLPEKRAPQLSDDVIIIRDSKSPSAAQETRKRIGSEPASPYSPRVNIVADLGERFLFKGAGADIRLAGSVRIESEPGQTPQAFGTVRVAEGSYEAFGTKLDIERGVFNFQGSLGDPNINILAMRREQEVAAGVQVTGTVSRPRVQLVSEPAVSDEEKLSWLVFGRSGGSNEQGQAQAAARGAALGLLNKLGGKRIGSRLGLDELSIGESDVAGLGGQQVVTLGKEITDRLYIGFEQSLASAASILKISYELTRHWSVVLRGGDVSGIAMSYNKRFNHLFGRESGETNAEQASKSLPQ